MAAVFKGGAGLSIVTVMEIDPNAVVTYFKIMFANSVLWFSTVIVVQLSIIFFYMRIFGVSIIFKWVCYILIAMITMFWVSGFFSLIFSCTPISRSWNSSETGTCLPYQPYCVSVGVLHVLFDLAIVALPMPMIWHLRADCRTKIVLSGLLCLGLM
ncbi:hypothetical protein INS49_010486 [Diaporthe citri]|uniref:uncharacterized protein n=1 Tax=Diaporthe citri TaxID=83186 RepID=UPI001C801327|nr:uncharacterized protein INS49_010486 [Diaporthe citri]KAG6362256.1 hypothetical protein INS49_010486 [Diaporthe citri]